MLNCYYEKIIIWDIFYSSKAFKYSISKFKNWTILLYYPVHFIIVCNGFSSYSEKASEIFFLVVIQVLWVTKGAMTFFLKKSITLNKRLTFYYAYVCNKSQTKKIHLILKLGKKRNVRDHLKYGTVYGILHKTWIC